MDDALGSLMRSLIIGLIIVTIAKVTRIERSVESMTKAFQVEVVK